MRPIKHQCQANFLSQLEGPISKMRMCWLRSPRENQMRRLRTINTSKSKINLSRRHLLHMLRTLMIPLIIKFQKLFAKKVNFPHWQKNTWLNSKRPCLPVMETSCLITSLMLNVTIWAIRLTSSGMKTKQLT